MPEKRKDSKGRVLKDGESQRANGTYDYRYTDIHKKRRCIYAKSLTELRYKKNKKAFLWTYEYEGQMRINIKVDPQWRDFWREAILHRW